MISPRSSAVVPVVLASALLVATLGASGENSETPRSPDEQAPKRWLAGDPHVNSRYTVSWDTSSEPPVARIGGAGTYPVPMNALMAHHHGLRWMVNADQGGPNHSTINRERAYPELLLAREAVPEVLQFYGLELNTPGGDRSSVIVAHHPDEGDQVLEIESRFDRLEHWPVDPQRDDPSLMIMALQTINEMVPRPLVYAHQPSRTSESEKVYGRYEPAELRQWHDTAPAVAVGMAGSPGHQAMTLVRDGTVSGERPRGDYRKLPTMGGFDPMTAIVGGLWDSLLGEGRRWWITASSSARRHYTEGGGDFWPGEYSKTYVYARPTYDSIMEGLREGRVFVVTGDLIDDLQVEARHGDTVAGIGGELRVPMGASVTITIRYHDPNTPNHHGDNPTVQRVDLITGAAQAPRVNPSKDFNRSTRVAARFGRGRGGQASEVFETSYLLRSVNLPMYVRVRGTNSPDQEPGRDTLEEDPWSDLWFYSNPIFISPMEGSSEGR